MRVAVPYSVARPRRVPVRVPPLSPPRQCLRYGGGGGASAFPELEHGNRVPHPASGHDDADDDDEEEVWLGKTGPHRVVDRTRGMLRSERRAWVGWIHDFYRGLGM
jgi:hypothetical protein